MMKNLISVLVTFGVLFVFSGCGDDTTIIEDHVSKITNVDLEMCEMHEDCAQEGQICRLDADRTEAEGFSIFTCQHGCDAELVYVEKEDGTSLGTKVPGTDTCQRFGNQELYCDLATHECAEYSDVEDESVSECLGSNDCSYLDREETFCSGNNVVAVQGFCGMGGECIAVDQFVEKCDFGCVDGECLLNPDLGKSYEVRYVEYCYSGGSFAGLFGQIAWSESTPSDPNAWKPGRDLQISVEATVGCFGTNVIWEDVLTETGLKTFYADMTEGTHTGIEVVDDLLLWLNVSWYPDTCRVDGVSGVLGDYVELRGHPCWVPEK